MSDFITPHAYNKHSYREGTVSTRNRTQYGKNINPQYIYEKTVNEYDSKMYKHDLEGNPYALVYKKTFDFNISTDETPTGESRVFINLIEPHRSSQFPHFYKT